ncbi:peptidylprolyl isomerase [Hamadaea sp. NPDC051192]|uniref:peptidylprolyl isomerase n=1 Tax=Hamadaea sp. NPDC051192 TaxID=3154940 RepID=UPI00341F0079
MTSTRERQRAAARARLEREMTTRAEGARKRRQRNAYIGAGLAVLILIGGGTWLGVSVFGKDKKTDTPAAAPSGCQWLPDTDTASNPNLKEVGTPATDVPKSGKQLLTLNTTQGKIEIEMNVTDAPCTTAAIAYLTGQKFFDNSKCHRMVTEGFKILQCGDPSATGSGGPTFKYAEENLPTGQNPAYERGVVAMAKTQSPSSTGSQFFLVDADIPLSDGQTTQGLTADYTVLGKIVTGLDVLDKVIKAGAVGEDGKTAAGDGKPKLEVKITSATVGAVQAS